MSVDTTLRIRSMDALDFYGRGTVAVQPGAEVAIVLYSDYANMRAERDTARNIAALLEHDVARLESVLDAVDAHFAAVEAEPGGPWMTTAADVRLVVAQLRAASADAALDDADGA